MAAVRACLIFAALVGFFVVGTPLQWLVLRVAPNLADRIPVAFCRAMLAILRVDVVFEGELVTDRPLLIASNHVSWIDILALGALRPFCFVAKSDVASWPIVAAFAEIQGTIFVDRKRRRTIPASNQKMAARMLEGRPVLLFPEGTTVGRPGPAPFLSSHFAAARDLLASRTAHASVAIQPTAIIYSSDAAAWVGDDDLLSHLWRTLRNPPLQCFVVFGMPIDHVAQSNRKKVARASREAVVAMIGARGVPRDERAGLGLAIDTPIVEIG